MRILRQNWPCSQVGLAYRIREGILAMTNLASSETKPLVHGYLRMEAAAGAVVRVVARDLFGQHLRDGGIRRQLDVVPGRLPYHAPAPHRTGGERQSVTVSATSVFSRSLI